MINCIKSPIFNPDFSIYIKITKLHKILKEKYQHYRHNQENTAFNDIYIISEYVNTFL